MPKLSYPSWKERISKHDYIINGALTHPFEAIHMGNGDIGASVNIYPHEIKITLAKSDIWDARFDGKPEEVVLKHDDLIKMVNEKDRDLVGTFDPNNKDQDFLVDRMAAINSPHTSGPAKKRAGCVRLYHPGLSNTRVETRVRLADGVLETRFFFSQGQLVVRAFAEKGNSRFWLEAESEGETPWFVIIVEKEPDDADINMPLPCMEKVDGNTSVIKQTIPAGFGIDEFSWCLASSFPVNADGVEHVLWAPHKPSTSDLGENTPLPVNGDGVDVGRVEHLAWRQRQYCTLEPGAKTALCVGIATDRDGGGDIRARALELVSARGNFEEIFKAHQAEWEKFWNASSIALDDEELESVWYRNNFGYGCAMSRNMTPLGSAGNVLTKDYMPWHGDIHTNHNFQKWYCTAFPTNHPEWIDVYADFIEDKMPIFEYQAKLIFDLDGAYCDLSYLPIMSPKHCDVNNLMGRALAVTGWMGQQLWWHWEYMRDKEWLRKRGYPYIKRAAEFYYNYLEKYSNESGEIYPSIRIEEPEWMRGFIGNRNVISDLCMFKKAFDRAIAASEVLDVDEDWREKWKTARARVPAIDHDIDENGEGWVALDKHWREMEPRRRADEARYSRWAGGGWIVYPGEYVEGDGDDSLTLALRDMLRRTDLMNAFISQVTGENIYPGVPIIHPISSIIPCIRLGVKEHFESIKTVLSSHRLTYGQTSSYILSKGEIPKEVNSFQGFLWYDWGSVENKYVGVLAITEMLFQSQGGLIRIFPFWPEGHDISFQGFRAIGGFIVSAKRENGKISATIKSTAGEKARVKWNKSPLKVTCEGKEVLVVCKDGVLTFDTVAGMEYECCED